MSGCQCNATVSDTHITERVSQIYMTQLMVSQHKQCEIEVTVSGVGRRAVTLHAMPWTC